MKKPTIKSVLAIVALAAASTFVSNDAAGAYSLTGCHWGTGNLRIDERDLQTHTTHLNSLQSAVTDLNINTNVNLSNVYVAGPAFVVNLVNSSTVGWEGLTTTNCNFLVGATNSTVSSLNYHYLPNTTNATQLKVVWEHELGHALGLDHVSGKNHVMYFYATGAYLYGVNALTADEINGINSLY
jgi:Matrixin